MMVEAIKRIVHCLLLVMVLIMFGIGSTCYAEDIDDNANAFTNLYLRICMQNINNLEALNARLVNSKLPKFPPEQAALFLHGLEGDTWPISQQGQLGNFVLTLPSGKNMCVLYARRASQSEVEHQFIKLVEKAPLPLVSEKRMDEQSDTVANGKTHTISYVWFLPQSKRKMLFILTTASFDNALLQAMGSASMVNE